MVVLNESDSGRSEGISKNMKACDIKWLRTAVFFIHETAAQNKTEDSSKSRRTMRVQHVRVHLCRSLDTRTLYITRL